jgi:hypothetical protein
MIPAVGCYCPSSGTVLSNPVRKLNWLTSVLGFRFRPNPLRGFGNPKSEGRMTDGGDILAKISRASSCRWPDKAGGAPALQRLSVRPVVRSRCRASASLAVFNLTNLQSQSGTANLEHISLIQRGPDSPAGRAIYFVANPRFVVADQNSQVANAMKPSALVVSIVSAPLNSHRHSHYGHLLAL